MSTEKLTYEKAATDLEKILKGLESDQISIDILADKVEEAGKLLLFCSDKLKETEAKVTNIVNKIDL